MQNDRSHFYNLKFKASSPCIADIVVEMDGRKVMPPVSCGLLAGTFRGSLLEEGDICEEIVTLDDLKHATRIWMINAVRRWTEAVLLADYEA